MKLLLSLSSFAVALMTLLRQKMKPLEPSQPALPHTDVGSVQPSDQQLAHTYLRELGAWLELLGAGPLSVVE